MAGEQAAQLQVLDLNGRLLAQYAVSPGQASYELPLTELPAGLYFLRVHSGEALEVVRFEKF
jgi:hypothetical protein